MSIHSTNLVAGTLFIVLGLSFILLRGTNALAGTYEGWGFTNLSFEADRLVKDATGGIPDVAFLALFGALAVAASVYAFYRLRREGDEEGAEELIDPASQAEAAGN